MKYTQAGADSIPQLVSMRIEYIRDDHGSLDAADEQIMRSRLPDYFERHLGVWLILLAVGLLFLSWTFRSSSVQERIHIKDRTITIIIVVALFFGVAGLITTVIQAGFDY